MDILIAWGVPSIIVGIVGFILKRYIDKRDKAREEHDRNIETIMLMIMKNSRSTYVLATATAKAVQRIPDAKCNGDMTKALADAEEIQSAEKDFLMDQGIKHIFDK